MSDPLERYQQIMKIWPWVNLSDAKRIVEEFKSLPPEPMAGRKSEPAYRMAKYAFAEAQKLKPSQ